MGNCHPIGVWIFASESTLVIFFTKTKGYTVTVLTLPPGSKDLQIQAVSAFPEVCSIRSKRRSAKVLNIWGNMRLKNISEPVRIYRILFRPEFEGKVIEASANRKAKLQKPYLIAIAVILICSGALLWFFYSRSIPIRTGLNRKNGISITRKALNRSATVR